MNNLNTVLVEGLLTRDPELKHMTAESTYCRMSIANNRFFIDKKGQWAQDTSYFTIFVYGKVADICNKYLKKGRGIRVVGRLKQYRYGDPPTRRENVVIIAEHIEFQPERKLAEKIAEKTSQPEKIEGNLETSFNPADIADPSSIPTEQHAIEAATETEECTVELVQDDSEDKGPEEF